MYVEAVVLGVLIGWFRKGRIGYFLNYPFRGRYVALVALLIFVAPYILCYFGMCENIAIFPYVSMVLCALIILANYKCLGMKILFVGLVLNLVIMGMNGFVMPIDTEKLVALGQTGFAQSIVNGEILNYRSLIGAQGISLIFGKVIALPSWYIHTVILSVGDVLSCIGIVLVVENAMVNSRKGDLSGMAITRWV